MTPEQVTELIITVAHETGACVLCVRNFGLWFGYDKERLVKIAKDWQKKRFAFEDTYEFRKYVESHPELYE